MGRNNSDQLFIDEEPKERDSRADMSEALRQAIKETTEEISKAFRDTKVVSATIDDKPS